MSSRRQTARQGLTLEVIAQWDSINPLALPEHSRAQFQTRVNALKLYVQHESAASILQQTGICRQSVDRFVKRSLIKMPDGMVAGFRALIPHSQIVELRQSDLNKLKARNPKPGVLAALFAKYPKIHLAMKEAAIYGVREGIKAKEPDMPVAVLHAYFIELCEKAGIQSPHYPFIDSADDPAGLPAIRKWAKRIRTEEALSRMRASNCDEEFRASIGIGPQNTTLWAADRIYKRLELDGHKIDLPLAIDMPSPRGEGVVRLIVDRIWIILGVEAKIGTAIGYALAIGVNYNSRDLVRAIQNCLKPWQPRKLTVSTVKYGPGEALPSGVIPELGYACFDEIAFDNAMAHRADHLLNFLERTTQSVPIWSPVASPNTHPYVEGFFNLLEELGIHRMQATTGSNPKDRRRMKKVDGRYLLTYDLLADLIDLLVCRINGSKAPGSDNTRLEILQKAVQRRSFIIRHVPIGQRDHLMKFDIVEEGVIGRDHGRPVIRYESARYHNKFLRSAMNLIGRGVTIWANSQNLQTIEVCLDDGTFLGVMQCEPRWALTPHSIETRREITRQLNKSLFVASGDDIVVGFNKHLEKTAAKSKRAARLLAKLQKEQSEAQSPEHQEGAENDIETGHKYSISSDAVIDDEDLELSADERAHLTTVYRR